MESYCDLETNIYKNNKEGSEMEEIVLNILYWIVIGAGIVFFLYCCFVVGKSWDEDSRL